MGKTSIEWVEGDDGSNGRSWNPVTGCTKVGTECTHCYAAAIAERFRGTKAFPHGFDLFLRPDRLREPEKWSKPSRVFVNSMSDLFHKSIPFDYIDEIFDVMELWAPQHTYMILTKRATVMSRYITHRYKKTDRDMEWLHDIWWGVSCGVARAKSRLSTLRSIGREGARTFISFEPLLEDVGRVDLDGIKWVIAGGESGSGARWMNPDWLRRLRDQCAEQGVPFFCKQMGSVWTRRYGTGGGKGNRLEQMPSDLRVRETPWP